MRSDAFRAAAEAKDFSALEELTTEDVVFRSPVVFKPYEGRDQLRVILAAVAQVFEDFRYTGQAETGDLAALRFEARIGDRSVEGVDLLDFAADGRIECLTVLIRPMSAVTALAERMRELLETAAEAGP